MEPQSQVSEVAHVIQLSVAPVFLMAGIGGLLGVLTNRLGRIIDRARLIEEKLGQGTPQEREAGQARLLVFSKRARLVNYAITLCTACASMVCLVIICLFGGALLSVDLAALISLLFVAAMLSLFSALICFLGEIRLATRSLRIGATTKG
ncbi:MAG TPA: DUF2721 domain-containing protein [Methylomirabilota bacterium]|nr:DUF2721 domain-containing protein [Methylomirabilota bacterium]